MSVLALAAARMVPLALVAPFGPISARLLVGGALSLAVAAAASSGAAVDSAASGAAWIGEIAIGSALGLAASIVVLAAESAGASLDEMRRSAVAHRSGEGGWRRAWRLLALALFAALGGPALVVDGIGRGYQALPMGAAGRSLSGGAAEVVEVGAQIIGGAIELAAPVLVAVLLADLALALVRRAAPSLARGVGAPGGAAARELFALGAVLAGSAGLVAALSARAVSVGDAMASAAQALAQ